MLRYTPGDDAYVGEHMVVQGLEFTDALGQLVDAGYDPAAAVDLLMRESSWRYSPAGLVEMSHCRHCGTRLPSGSPLNFCSVLCHAAGLADSAWPEER